jgi:hypothetical protein
MTAQSGLLAAGLRTCSACGGDYEDPELTARSDASEEEDAENANDGHANDANAERSVPRERSPVQEK